MAKQNSRTLLTREDFTNGVLARDGHRCVFCGSGDDLSAHHIIERRLYNDGGYYLDNGASVCPEHHMLAETTELSVEQVLAAAGIANPVYPAHIPMTEKIDKWGNTVLPNGQRLRGEMFEEEQVQKVLAQAGLLHLFTDHRKYPRTYHLPFSQGVQSDDKMLKSTSAMSGRRMIGTIKMDGENTTLYSDHMHARSLDSKHNYSRDEVKAFWSSIRQDIPERWRVCGENMWGVHSIEYQYLTHVFYGFSVWNERNVALPWDEGQDSTLEWFDLLGIRPVDVVYDGIFDEAAMEHVAREVIGMGHEGVVFRVADEIPYREFSQLAAKVVRENHVQTDQHWMVGKIRRNGFVTPEVAASSGVRFPI